MGFVHGLFFVCINKMLVKKMKFKFNFAIKRKTTHKIINIGYALAVVFAFVLSLTNNNNVKASTSKDERIDYLMIENSVAESMGNPETIYPDASFENIKNLYDKVITMATLRSADKEIVVEKGDTLISIFNKLGLSREQANDVFYELKKHYDPRDLRAGQKLQAKVMLNPQSGEIVELKSLTIEKGVAERVIIALNENNEFQISNQIDELVEEVNSATGTISGTLLKSMQNKGVPSRTVNNFIKIFAYTVDFRRDVHKGDKFEIIYENKINPNGQVVKSGAILYASLTLGKTKLSLYRFKDKKGNVDYYNEKGMAMKKTLHKKPLAFQNARISSPFGKRRHPILKKVIIHWGIDYAAPKGTAIFAGGDGVVQVAKYNGSYGNYIKIRHNSEYSTAYGHMWKFAKGIRPGTRVKQGQVIGYVGSTGRSTGPHLHYEVIQNGKRVNPRSIKASTGENLKGENLRKFKKLVADIQSSYKNMFAQTETKKVAKK